MDNRRRFDAVDTRLVFRVYAALACLSGLALMVRWPALNRLFGSILIAAACSAAALAEVDDPRTRRQGLFWFAGGHLVVSLVLMTQQSLALPGSEQLVWVASALFYLGYSSEGMTQVGLTSVFAAPGKRLRSDYEQQIRQSAAQEERTRLARDLHDAVKQQLFAIQTAAATVQARLDADPAGAGEALEQVRHSAREAMTEMQVMTDQLRSGPLENTGLIEALKRHTEALGFRTGADVTFHLEGDLPPSEDLPPGAHQAILRVAEEALANVARHARARHVRVSLYSAPGRVEIRIKDDGAGFDPNQNPRGMGIANMRARAEEFDGEFELVSQPGGGTFVRFSVPYMTALSPREYRQKALVAAAVLTGFAVYVIWTRQYASTAVAAICVIDLIRNARAYRRARKPAEVRR